MLAARPCPAQRGFATFGEQLRPLTVPSGLSRSPVLCSSLGETAERRILLPASPPAESLWPGDGDKKIKKTLPVVPRRRESERDFRGKGALSPNSPLTPGNSADLTLLRYRPARK